MAVLSTAKQKVSQGEKNKKSLGSNAVVPVAQPLRTHADRRKIFMGIVTSDKMQKTIVVRVERQVRHLEYKKYMSRSRNVKAHDEKNEAKVGDRVQLVESRRLSKDKRWALQKILRRANPAQVLSVIEDLEGGKTS